MSSDSFHHLNRINAYQQPLRFGREPLKPDLRRPLSNQTIREMGPRQGVSIGREGGIALNPQDTTISRHHVAVQVDDRGRLWIWQTGRTNHSFLSLDGIKMDFRIPSANKTQLLPGAKIHVGRSILVVTRNRGLALFTDDAPSFRKLFPHGIATPHLSLQQQNTGDCYLIAALYALAMNPVGERIIANMIKPTPGGWEVRFPNHSSPILVRQDEVDGQRMPDGQYHKPVYSDLGWRVLERAYGKMRRAKEAGDQPFIPGLLTMRILNQGGYSHRALHEMLGWEKFYISNDKESRIQEYDASSTLRDFSNTLDRLSRDPHRYLITAYTPTDRHGRYKAKAGGEELTYMDREHCFITNHAFVVKSIDRHRKTVTLVDPKHTLRWVKTISYQHFFDCFSTMTSVQVPEEEYGT